ncbi:MAG: dipeptide ABC transporter ATP-binding protein [Pseudomonadota bacterium]
MNKPVINIRDVSIGFTGKSGATLPVLRNIDLDVAEGESVGIVGESGSGKSTLALAAMGYLKRGLRLLGGSVAFRGLDMFSQTRPELEKIRGGELALIPQNSGQSLTPTLRIGAQLIEALRLHSSVPASDHVAKATELLGQVRLPDPKAILSRFPHELSGGQQQRAAVAMALAGEPHALLLDEPTTGLDVTTQAHILELLRDIARERGTAMVYVSHDLGAIARVCDRVVVMYAGEVVLEGSTRQVLKAPRHPYARGLLASIPRLADHHLPVALDGRPPAPGGVGDGCSFVERCALAQDICKARRPELTRTPDGELVRCFRADQAEQLALTGSGTVPVSLEAGHVPALKLDDLSISYHQPNLLDQILGRQDTHVATVDDIDIAVQRGETLGLVGESGSGKSTILKSIAGLLPPVGGTINMADGEPLSPSVEGRSPDHLRRVQLIFQNPDDSLNPRHTVAEILEQPLRLYFGLSGTELHDRSVEILGRVRLGAHYLDRLPSQLSGGEKQRVAIARAFAADPELVLCDEVTSALDVSVQAAVLDLLNELKEKQGTTYVFVSHDLAVVKALSDRVAVLYQGRLCEIGKSHHVYSTPSHPYTEVLLGAVLEPDPDTAPTLSADDVVELSPRAQGCPFQRRCPRKLGSICDTEIPPWHKGADGHAIRCHIGIEQLAVSQTAEAAQ